MILIPLINYEYITEEISYFNIDTLNKVANKFTFVIVLKNCMHYHPPCPCPIGMGGEEFEAFLINEIKETPIIYKTILHPYQFTYLGEELFKSLQREGLANIENKSDKLVFRFKLR